MADQKFKSKVRLQGGASLPNQTAERVPVIDVNGDIVSSSVTETELGHLSGVTSAIQTQIDANETAIADHIADAVDAHDASAISNAPSGNLAATDVQSALNELQTDVDSRALQSDLQAHLDDTIDAHDASAISNVAAGNLAANNVQDALNELQSDIDTRALDADVIKKDGSVVFTAAQSMGGFKLVSLADPTLAQDAATKAYVDAVAQGLNIKSSAKAATTAALPAVTASGSQTGKTLTADANGVLTIDGISTWVDVDNDGGSTNPTDSIGTRASRVLIKDQANAVDNGIYVVQNKGDGTTPFELVRAVDADGSPAAEVESVFLFIREGSTNADSGWTLVTDNPTVDTDPLAFTQFSGAGSIEAGAALEKSGNTLNVLVDGQGIEIVADQLSLELDGATLSKSASGLKLSDTAVTPGEYGSATETVTITVDQQGRLTASSEQAIAIPSTQVTDFTEAAQDAVGGSLVDSASVDFTYDDVANTITAAVLPAGVDHDALLNFVANEHVDHSAVQIATAADSGLAGGGDITATRNLSVDITGTTALSATPDGADEFILWDASVSARRKVTYTELLAGVAQGSAGDISETSFSVANNQTTAADVTGFAFAAGVVRGFKALVTVEIDATADLFETFELVGINKGGSFEMAISGVGDESGIVFSITTAGQVQYTSANYAGFVSGAIKFRAETTTV